MHLSLKRIDKWLAIICIIFLVALLVILKFIVHYPDIYSAAVIVGIIACLIYLIICKKAIIQTERNSSLFSISFLLGVIFYAFSLWIWINRPDTYIKPLFYYIYLSIAVGLLFIAAYCSIRRLHYRLIIVMACAIGLLNLWTETLMFSSVIGLDTWTHMRLATQEIPIALSTEPNIYGLPHLSINTIGGYYSLMHLYLNGLMQLTSLDYKMTALIFWSSLQVIANVILIYLIAKQMLGSKVGIIACLLLTIGNWFIFFSEWSIPNTIGVTFSLFCAYLIMKWQLSYKWWAWIPIVVVLAISFMTHIIASVWVIGTVACMLILPKLFSFGDCRKVYIVNLARSLIIPIVMVLCFTAWIQLTTLHNALKDTTGGGTYDPYVAGLTIPIASSNANAVNGATDSTSMVSIDLHKPIVTDLLSIHFWELLLDSMGMFLYFGLAIIGCLMLFKRVYKMRVTWVTFCVGVIAIGFLPSILGISLIEHRWWYFGQVLLSIPLAVAIIGIVNYINSNFKLIIIGTVISIVSFLSIIGLPSNLTNRNISNNLIVTYGLTKGEMQGFEVAKDYDPKYLGSDSYYLAYVQSYIDWYYPIRTKVTYIEDNIINGNFIDCRCDVILLRDSLWQNPFGYGSGAIFKVGYNPVELAKKQGYEEVYDNGEIHCLRKVK